MLNNEDVIYKKALEIRGGDRRVMICDRGVMDAWAYMSDDDFKAMLHRYGLNRVSARDERYDAVFHLVTAADGAVEHYNQANSSRFESPEGAIKADRRTQNAWLGHPHLRIVDNSTDFGGKMRRLLAKVKRALGIPEPIETERKFLLLSRPDPNKFPVPVQRIVIHQDYLADAEGTRIRWRGQENEGNLLYKTVKIPTDRPDSSVEIESIISEEEWRNSHTAKDQSREQISKLRYHFVWKNQYFELDYFLYPQRLRTLVMLEIELDNEHDLVEIPEWLGPVTETADPAYKNRQLAKRP